MEMSSDLIRNNSVNRAGILREGPSPGRCPVGEQRRPGRHQKTARTGWSKEMNVAVMECYFLSRPFDEEGKPIRGFRKRMHNIWKERQGLKVTEQRLCEQARMIRMNEWLTELEMNAIKKNDQNSGNDDNDDQGEATENECEKLANVFLSFENVEERSEREKMMIKNIIEIAEHNLDEEVNGFKKVDRNSLEDWTIKEKDILKEIKSDITETNRLIRACAIFVGRKVDLKSNQRRGNAVKELWLKRRIQQSKQETRKHINILERKKHGEIIKKERYKVIEHKYSVKKKELNVVLEELKKNAG